jgi:V/A-type H+-transporting ATPase subunit D
MSDKINSTRLELSKLKNQLTVTRRGHHLLKDKLDEMIKDFFSLVKEYNKSRQEIELDFENLLKNINLAKIFHTEDEVKERLNTTKKVDIKYSTTTFMTQIVPEIIVNNEFLPIYSPFDTTIVFTKLAGLVSDYAHKFFLFCALEKKVYIFAHEIERSRRRVNAIEHILLPEIEANIKSIANRLDDDERSNQIRLMKAKELIINKK